MVYGRYPSPTETPGAGTATGSPEKGSSWETYRCCAKALRSCEMRPRDSFSCRAASVGVWDSMSKWTSARLRGVKEASHWRKSIRKAAASAGGVCVLSTTASCQLSESVARRRSEALDPESPAPLGGAGQDVGTALATAQTAAGLDLLGGNGRQLTRKRAGIFALFLQAPEGGKGQGGGLATASSRASAPR